MWDRDWQPSAWCSLRPAPGRGLGWGARRRQHARLPGTQLAHGSARGSCPRSCAPSRQEEHRGLCPASGAVRWLSWQAVPVARHYTDLSSRASTWRGSVSEVWRFCRSGWEELPAPVRVAGDCSWLRQARHVPEGDGTAQHLPRASYPSCTGSRVRYCTKMLKSRGDF